MKRILIIFALLVLSTVVFAQQYEIPAGAVLLESTVMKDNGKPYLIEALYRLRDGSQMSVYYDADGRNEVIVQRVLAAKTPAEQQQILSTQRPVFNISAANMQSLYQNMPGFIRYKFNDRYEMSQFMKIMKIERPYGGNSPSGLQDCFSTNKPAYLMYDKYDESWSIESSYGTSYRVDKIR
ncbi:MAG: hypothetical protein LBL44_07630 [Treponema sp.]|jgi:hypothetical protein|nr:hypothetical protein [Treponema sp.]